MDKGTALWYEKPAANFDEALPVGNGRIGGMVYGKVSEELINLNEDSIWSGGKRNRNNPNAYEGFTEVRELLKNGRTSEAQSIVLDKMAGVPLHSRHYMPLGNLTISMSGMTSHISDYVRSLDLNTALCQTSFRNNGITYRREVFASHPDKVIVVRIESDSEKAINVSIGIDGRDDYYDDNRPVNRNTVLFTGGTGSSDGVFFASAVIAEADGEISTCGNKIYAKNSSWVTIVVSVQTSFRHEDYKQRAVLDAQSAMMKGYMSLRKDHIQDYSSLYERVRFELSDNSDSWADSPTDKRIKRVAFDGAAGDRGSANDDNKLIELYFNYGRYLMISASREGTLPMNLQGIWNKEMWPKWGGRYTLNANTQMSYWSAEVLNLSECHMPLIEHIEKIRENGRITAKEMYHCKGFMCHHNTDIWGDTAPQDLWMPSTMWPMGAAWLCLHIYEHYLYTMDKDFLSERFDTMKEAAEFFVDYLTDDGKGHLVTGPSVSPENSYIDANGVKVSLCMGPSMDTQILMVLFDAVCNSADILERDKEFAEKLRKISEKLNPIEIGKYGHIKEWAEEYAESDIGHTHISQLFALYPASLITPYKAPHLAKAARATLVRRLVHGSAHLGWSRAWIINFWARLFDAEMVYEHIQKLLAQSTNSNMLNFYPPFQIDGNFGGCTGIAEALMQSHDGIINLLPALPSEWETGSITGLCARGGFRVSIFWKNGELEQAEIISLKGEKCSLRANTDVEIICNSQSVDKNIDDGIVTFDTQVGSVYSILKAVNNKD